MKAWELMYKDKVLSEAKKIVGDVNIIQNDGCEIVGEVENFKVTTYIEYNSPTYASCECPLQNPCKHDAALIYYLEMHPELINDDSDFETMVNVIDESDLKRFLIDEFKSNSDLKNKFLKEFENTSLINHDFYENKLNKLFESGKDRDFEYTGYYNLNFMKSGLNTFLNEDIEKIILAGEYDFACDLLCRIGDLLDEEIMSSYDSWYDLSDSFMKYVEILSTSIYLDSEKMNELYSKTGFITDVITVF